MRYKLLGKSGLRVSELCLGTMTFGTEWGWGSDKKQSRQVFDAFVEAGGNFIDTANRYTEGTSEKYVGEFIKEIREKIVLATKYTLYMDHGDPNSAGNSRKNMMQAVERSLQRLGTDYIDLYWVHAWDQMTPIDEVLRGLDDLVSSGKVLYIGISDTPAWIVSAANVMAELRGWARFVGLQIEYSLIERTVERDLLPMARAFDMAVTPWGAIGGGVLTGKYNKEHKKESDTKRYSEDDPPTRMSEANLKIAEEVVKVADELEVSPAQVAINWVRQKNQLIIPIIGARTPEHVRDNIGCLDNPLPDGKIAQLDQVSAIEPGFPHDFLTRDYIRNLVFGGTYDKIDNHRA